MVIRIGSGRESKTRVPPSAMRTTKVRNTITGVRDADCNDILINFRLIYNIVGNLITNSRVA